MNLNRKESLMLVDSVLNLLPQNLNVEIVFSPSFTYLYKVNKMCLLFDNIFTSAQDCSKEENGAFTGEVSASMINSLGSKYTILGHSERREYFSETNIDLKHKVDVALNNNLEVIFCCGENLNQRNEGVYLDWIKSQITESLFHLEEEFQKIVIAYEPVWAIGTGVTASSDQAEKMHLFIRNLISERYGNDIAEGCSIIYGGSCNSLNAKDLFSKPNIDGGLIGGASLVAQNFVDVIKSF